MIDSLLTFVSGHCNLTYVFIFLVSLLESLALVGLLIPGTVVMFGIGALVGVGSIRLQPTLVSAALGAISGDAISYWIGHFYQDRLKNMWPFSRYAHLLDEGENFFRNHGGKSVFLGRFIGPIRPIIPLVAGIMDMPVFYFTFVNIISAVGWAFVYVIPGVILGTSLTIAGIVSTRLIILMLLVTALLWVFLWSSKKVFRLVAFASSRWIEILRRRAKAGGERSIPGRIMSKTASFLVEGFDRNEHIFPLMLFLCVLCTSGFVVVVQAELLGSPPFLIDQSVFHLLQSVRNPFADGIFSTITGLGDGTLFLLVSVSLAGMFLYRRASKSALLVFLSWAGSYGLVSLFERIIPATRPLPGFWKGISAHAFPSAHTVYATVLFGMLFILLLQSIDTFEISARARRLYRWALFSASVAASSFVGFSRLYLGINWFSGVIGGFFLGWGWVSLCALFYLKSAHKNINFKPLVIVTSLAFAIFYGCFTGAGRINYLPVHGIRIRPRMIETREWLLDGWEKIPVLRLSIRGKIKQPLTVQYLGNPNTVVTCLLNSGWKTAGTISLRSLLTTLAPDVHLYDLPILPRLLNGKRESLVMYRDAEDRRLVFRMWTSGLESRESLSKLYVGTAECQVCRKVTPWITVAVDNGDYQTPLNEVCREFRGANFTIVRKNYFKNHGNILNTPGNIRWDGTVVLVTQKRSMKHTRRKFP